MGCGNSAKNAFMDTFRKMSQLKNIEILDISIEKQPFFDLIQELSLNQNVESFAMRNVDLLGDNNSNIIILSKTLEKKKTIKRIEFKCINGLGEKVGKSILMLSERLPDLEFLSLIEIKLEDEDARYIGKIFEDSNLAMNTLNLSGNFFNSELEPLLYSFKNLVNIKTLILQKFGLNKFNSVTLLTSLANVTKLEELDLSNNSLRSAVKYFDGVLESNKNLKILKLNNSTIADKHFSYLDDILRKNTSVRFLELNSNDLGKDSAGTVKSLIEGNSTLVTIYMLQNKLRMTHVEDLIQTKHKHRCIMEF